MIQKNKTLNTDAIDIMQQKSMDIIASSKIPSPENPIAVPSLLANLPTSYSRREEMAKTCLMEMQVADELSKKFVATPLFGFRTQPAIFAAIMIGFDEGKSPTVALRDYCEIKGATLAKYGAAFLRDFARFGGSFEIVERSRERAAINFTFQGKTVLFEWTAEEAKIANLLHKDNWKYYRADMLYWRCVARGVRSICPQATGGFYLPEEKGMLVDRDGVPLQDSLTATRPMRSLPPEQKKQISTTAQAKPAMSPDQIKQWCIEKGKIIKEALVKSSSIEELESIAMSNSKILSAIKRGYPSAAARLKKTYDEMVEAIEWNDTHAGSEPEPMENAEECMPGYYSDPAPNQDVVSGAPGADVPF